MSSAVSVDFIYFFPLFSSRVSDEPRSALSRGEAQTHQTNLSSVPGKTNSTQLFLHEEPQPTKPWRNWFGPGLHLDVGHPWHAMACPSGLFHED